MEACLVHKTRLSAHRHRAGAGVLHSWPCLSSITLLSSSSNNPIGWRPLKGKRNTPRPWSLVSWNIGLYFWHIQGSWQTSTPCFPGSALQGNEPTVLYGISRSRMLTKRGNDSPHLARISLHLGVRVQLWAQGRATHVD